VAQQLLGTTEPDSISNLNTSIRSLRPRRRRTPTDVRGTQPPLSSAVAAPAKMMTSASPCKLAPNSSIRAAVFTLSPTIV
jgi:hypothetical protein